MNVPDTNLKRVVIVGGGFAGMELAKKLSGKPFQVLLLDRNNFFTFQPLLYQVATSGLEPNSVAYPFRKLIRKRDNVFFRMAEVTQVFPAEMRVETSIGSIDYDYLVIASGSAPNFFGLEPSNLLTLKSLNNALDMRNHILREFEHALEREQPEVRKALVNIVIVGGGPTGVELAGAFAEMKKHVLAKDYPQLDLDLMHIHLIEGMDRLLPAMSEAASQKAKIFLENMGVQIWLNELIEEYDGKQVEVDGNVIPIRTLIWTAGVQGARIEGVDDFEEEVKGNRIPVDQFNRVDANGLGERIFAIGDIASMSSEELPRGHPMLAPVAIQQGKHLGKNLLRINQGKPLLPFKYKDNGTMATIGRNRAVADLPFIKLQGVLAWFIWMFVHLFSLVGFRNKLITVINWTYNYFTYDRALRLIIRKKSGS